MPEKCPKCGKNSIAPVVDGMCIFCWRDKWSDALDDLRRQLAAANERNKTLLGLLRECEWAAEEVTGDSQSESMCPMCQAWRRDGHAPNCRLVAALKENDNG